MHPARRRAGWSRTAWVWLLAVTLFLWLSGTGLFLWPQDADIEWPEHLTLLKRLMTVGHGSAAWGFCLLAGRWVWPHVTLIWHKTGHSTTWGLGLLLLGTAVCMALTGLGLLYGSAHLHELAVPVHGWLGLLWPALLGAHAWRRLLHRH